MLTPNRRPIKRNQEPQNGRDYVSSIAKTESSSVVSKSLWHLTQTYILDVDSQDYTETKSLQIVITSISSRVFKNKIIVIFRRKVPFRELWAQTG